ncbi:MAG: HlyC/CorC family transporter [Treponema sp.]|nr:HlyC/CorC family transporter [Candidatus Treponema equifaecale]
MDGQPPSNNLILLLLIAAACIVLSSLFSASESAFLGLNKLKVHFLREKGDKRAIRTSKLLEKKEELLNMLLVGNEIVNVALSVVLTSIFLKLFGPAGLGIATGIATILLLLFGEITPKSITTKYPESFAFSISGFVKFFFYLLRPFVIFFTTISRLLLKIFGIDIKKKSVSFTEEEIKTFIDVGGEEGVLEKGEKNMMNRVFKFSDLEAVDIMIPRTKIVGIHPGMNFRDIVQLSERTRLSRFPVYEEDLDNIIGVVHVKDLVYFPRSEEFSVKNVMRKPLFIPATTKMSAIQSILQEHKENFAVVIDEYSGTDGILTTEDIAREIFGGVFTESEQNGPSDIAAKDFDNAVLEGSARLSDLSEDLHTKLESDINETIAGYMIEKLDRLPIIGDSIEVPGYKLTVTALDKKRISKILCTKLETEEEEEENADLV